MSERKPAVIRVGEEILRTILVTAAANGGATGMPLLASITALPDALIDSETLTLPVPPFWTGSAQAWQSICTHIEHHFSDILQDVEKQLQSEKTLPTQQIVRQALVNAIARHLPDREVTAQERSGVADYLAPLLLQQIAAELKAVVDPIRNDKVAEMLTQLFEQLSAASQPVAPTTTATTTLATLLQQKMQQRAYDVFFCYDEADESEVMKLAEQLKARGLLPWLDIIDVRPGTLTGQQQEEQIEKIPAAAIIVGQHAVANWQELQMYSFIDQFVARQIPVIPVLLADAPQKPKLRPLLANFGWVDFRRQIPDPLNQLQWGITGKRP